MRAEISSASRLSPTASSSSSSSPVSEWSSTTEEDIDAPETTAAQRRQLQKSGWYVRVKEGKHLPEMRKLHSYICGGKADWSNDLAGIARSKKSASTKATSASQLETFKKKRMSLLEARTRLFRGTENSVFARLCSSSSSPLYMYCRPHLIRERHVQVERAHPVVALLRRRADLPLH